MGRRDLTDAADLGENSTRTFTAGTRNPQVPSGRLQGARDAPFGPISKSVKVLQPALWEGKRKKRRKLWCVELANFHGVNVPAMVDFTLNVNLGIDAQLPSSCATPPHRCERCKQPHEEGTSRTWGNNEEGGVWNI